MINDVLDRNDRRKVVGAPGFIYRNRRKHVLAWGPVIVGLVVSGVQFVGARLLAMLGDSGPDLRPLGQREVRINAPVEPDAASRTREV